MHPPLDELLSVESLGSGRFRAHIPDGWQQGRGAFGGLVVGLMTRALSDPDRELRSLTAALPGPVLPGEAILEVEPLRAGSAVTTQAVRLLQDNGIQAHAVAIVGRPRTTDHDAVAIPPPEMSEWRRIDRAPVAPPMGPAFAQFFDFRPLPPFPFAGGNEAAANGWIWPNLPGTRRDDALLVACIDAYWPTLLAKEAGPRPMATIAFTFQPVSRPIPEGPWFYRARLLASDSGYSVEQRELWSQDGRLLALNQQTFAIIK